MSPRPYRMEKRQAARDETRDRILNAARQLLAGRSSTDLSLEAIARRADVSRLTIYYQFGSRAGLLEALYDHLAARGDIARLAEVFQQPDVRRALRSMVRTFVGFWSSDAGAMRRLRAMSALDAEIGRGVSARDARRPQVAVEVLSRVSGRGARTRGDDLRRAASVVAMLTSFEAYDALSRSGLADAEIVEVLASLVECAAGPVMGGRSPSRAPKKRRPHGRERRGD